MGKVSWGCTGVQACSDTTHWMAGPDRSYCGKTFQVCHGSQCTSGTVYDFSSADKWEAGGGRHRLALRAHRHLQRRGRRNRQRHVDVIRPGTPMAKSALKTVATTTAVSTFLAKVEGDERRADCSRVIALMEEVVGAPAKIWGGAIVGIGEAITTYPDGRELDWFVCGLASRKSALTLYGLLTSDATTAKLLAKLGSHTIGKGCLYVKKLSDVDLVVLRELIRRAAKRQK